MSIWSIEGKGIFSELGLEGLSRTLVSQSPDKVSFSAPGYFDDEPLLSYGETAIIKKDNSRWFYGHVITIPKMGNSSDERITYELAGPWFLLEKCVYQQTWKLYDGGLVNKNKSRVILNQNSSGERITSGAQIVDAVNYAVSKGAPIQLGIVDPAVNLPFDEQTDVTCAEVIVKMLRWSPECIAYFDYSTSPYPTFHCRKRSGMPSVSIPVNGQGNVESILITPRYDLQVPGVVINYEKTNTVNDISYEIVIQDTAGNINDIETLITTIELAGSRATLLTQRVETEDWPSDLNDREWWKARMPALTEMADSDFTVHDAARSGILSRILKEGMVQDWMIGKVAEDDTVKAKLDYVKKDAENNEVHKVKDQDISIKVSATNCATRTYQRLGSYEAGEPVPADVAAKLYESWSELQYDGQIILVEEEVSGNFSPGRKLNLSGGEPAWASMNALVQQVDEDVDEGRTTITIGPPRHLGPDDLVTLLRSFRTRRPSWRYIARTTGVSSDTGSTELSGPVAKNEVNTGASETKEMVMTDDSGSYKKKLNFKPSEISKDDADVEIKPREVYIIDTSDQKAYKRQILASDKYGDAIEVGGGGGGLDLSKVSFGFSISGSTATINGGKFRIIGVASWQAAEKQVSLSEGQTQYTYLRHAKDHSSTSIEVAAALPGDDDDTWWIVPLQKFESLECTKIYRLGDINVAAIIK